MEFTRRGQVLQSDIRPQPMGARRLLFTRQRKDRKNDERHQIEQNDSYFEDAHPGVVKGVELVTGQAKPSA